MRKQSFLNQTKRSLRVGNPKRRRRRKRRKKVSEESEGKVQRKEGGDENKRIKLEIIEFCKF